jgi:septal ring factor EnvC (AmiA/AmiB activator)
MAEERISLDLLTVMGAMNSDDAKAKVFEDLRQRMQELADTKVSLDNQQREVTQAREETRRDRAEAQAARDEVRVKSAALAQETEGLRSAVETHHRDKTAFEEIRQKIDADHDAREAALKQRESWADERDAAHAQKTAELTARENEVAAREDEMKRRHEALRQALAA